MSQGTISRRAFCAAVAAVALFPASFAAAATATDCRRLRLRNAHTGEDLDLTYCRSGEYDPAALDALNHFLRCHHTGEVAQIDPAVVDLLCDVRRAVGTDARIRIISGYRSPAYNEYLRRRGRGVARHSLHTQGLALDFAVPGVSSARLTRVARSFAAGGVGTYPDFVHIDTGRVRHWWG